MKSPEAYYRQTFFVFQNEWKKLWHFAQELFSESSIFSLIYNILSNQIYERRFSALSNFYRHLILIKRSVMFPVQTRLFNDISSHSDIGDWKAWTTIGWIKKVNSPFRKILWKYTALQIILTSLIYRVVNN